METLPDTVLTDRERRTAIAHIRDNGLFCICGNQATDTESEAYETELWTEPEPSPWWCGCCQDCGLRGHEPGTNDCPLEVN